MSEISSNLHSFVKAWLIQHKREQDDRGRALKGHDNGSLWWKGPLPDLTKRDLYRFNTTSEIFKAIEATGCKIVEAPITGKVIFLASNEKVECSIVEKMFKPLKSDGAWTAYPEHHQTGLQSTGFLRVTINTYIGRKAPEWIETKEKKITDLLHEISTAIISAGKALVQFRQDREQAEHRRREDEARRQELRRVKQIEDGRWARFDKSADDWERRARLVAFVGEIKKRIALEGDAEIAGQGATEWVQWAEAKIAALDPFGRGVVGLFEAVLGPSEPQGNPFIAPSVWPR